MGDREVVEMFRICSHIAFRDGRVAATCDAEADPSIERVFERDARPAHSLTRALVLLARNLATHQILQG
jgi:hypothetical protein